MDRRTYWRHRLSRFAPGSGHNPRDAFSLIELMVTIAILGIVSSVVFTASGLEWRRERVNALANEFAGWLDAVRRSSLRGNACQVTITPNTYNPGTAFATGSELNTTGAGVALTSNCLSQDPFRVPGLLGNGTINVTVAPTTQTSFVFTPRGNVSGATAPLGADLVIAFVLNGQPPTRCVRLSQALGLIQIGRNDGAVTNPPACNNYAFGL